MTRKKIPTMTGRKLRAGQVLFGILLGSSAVVAFVATCGHQDIAATGGQASAATLARSGHRSVALAGSFSDVASRVTPSVVNIHSTRVMRGMGRMGGVPRGPFFLNPFLRHFFGRGPTGAPIERKVRSLGSGVIISSDGYIVTNYHVVAHATDIRVSLPDRRTFPAKVKGKDPRTDLALLKIDAKGLKPIRVGRSSDLRVGDVVLAVGNPFGVGETVTMGIVSAVGRAGMGITDYEDFIQTDAAINPGNSGGPLLNILGQLIGINTAIHKGGSGIGFAIPIDRVKQAVRDLLRFGHVRGGYLGMSVTPYQGPGLVVTSVVSGGPAARAGIHVRDVVLGIRGKAINATQDFTDAVAHMIPGERVAFQLQNRIARITIGAYTAPIAWRQFQLRLGIRVGNAATLATRYHLSVTRGIVLTWVKRSGVAWRVGLRAGDVILRINRKLTANTAQLYRLAPIFRLGTTLVMIVQRKTALYRATVPY